MCTKKIIKVIIVLILVSVINNVYSWEQLKGGPYKNYNITDFDAMGDTLFKVEDSVLYLSKDNGVTWVEKYKPFTQICKIYGDNIFSARTHFNTGWPGAYRTISYSYLDGSQWRDIDTLSYPYLFGTLDILTLPGLNNTPKCFYSSFFVSSSGGSIRVKGIETDIHMVKNGWIGRVMPWVPLQFENIGDNLFFRADTVVMTYKPKEGIVRIGEGVLPTSINSILSVDSSLLVSTDEGLFSSPDLGENFKRIDNGVIPTNFTSIFLLDSVVLGKTTNCFSYSIDTGKTWTNPSILPHFKFTVGATKIFAIQSNGIVFYSNDYGVTWQSDNNGAYATIEKVIATDSAIISSFGSSLGSSVYISKDRGTSWASNYYPKHYYYGTSYVVNSIEYSNNTIFAGLYTGTSHLGLSVDPNVNVNVVNISNCLNVRELDGTIYALPIQNFIIRYIGDSGDTLIDFATTKDSVNCFNLINDKFFIGTKNGLKLAQNGIAINMSTPVTNVKCIESIDSTIFISSENDGVFVSQDSGKTWAVKSSGLLNLNVHSLVTSGNNVLVGTDDGLFMSTDLAENWIAIDSGLPFSKITALDAFEDTVYVSGENMGIWKKTISSNVAIGPLDGNSLIKKTLRLIVKNNKCVIKFNTLTTSDIRFSIYSLSGRLINEQILTNVKRGVNVIKSKELNSGLYIVSFEADNFKIVDKVRIF